MDTLQRIKTKLNELRTKDKSLSVFGSAKHQYQFNPVKTEKEIIAFEEKYAISLPKGYRDFLMEVGNGNTGPYYGLESLEDSLFEDLDYREPEHLINPGEDFPHTEQWNLSFEEEDDEKRDELYFDKKWMNGTLKLANYGCGVSMCLVVKGKEAGHIWVDDRCNDGGIYPDYYFGNKEKIDFLTWYELWLDESLSSFQSNVNNEAGRPDSGSYV